MKDQTNRRNAPTCSSCNTVFDVYYHCPRILTKCGHTICEKCITNKTQTRGNKKIFACCECQNQTIVRRTVEQQFPKNAKIIEVLKEVKRHNFSSNQKTPPLSPRNTQKGCFEHNKPLQLKCMTCKQQLICSHCGLFGKHKNHVYRQIQQSQDTLSQNDVKQLKKAFSLLQNTVENNLVPCSQNNLLLSSQKSLREGLYKLVKLHFRQYYEPIERKQQQMIKQCEQIKIEGGIQGKVDRILQEYELLKLRYQNCLNISSYQSNQIADQIINRAVSIHDEISMVQKTIQQKVSETIHSIASRMNTIIAFRIQELPITLKGIYQPNKTKTLKDEKGRRTTSPNLSARKLTPSKAVTRVQDSLDQKNITRLQFKMPKENILNKQAKKPSLERCELRGSDYIEDASQIVSQNQYQVGSVKSHQYKKPKLINLAQKSDNGKIPRPQTDRNNTGHNSSQTPLKQRFTSKGQISRDNLKINKPNLPTTPRGAKKSEILLCQNEKIELKYVKPIKQINYELRPKLQQICGQIDRQYVENSGTNLQLIGLEINDMLLWYITQHIRSKKYKFSMIKMVKNNITDEGFRMLLSYLAKDSYTKVLNMTSNQITAKGLIMLLQFADSNNILRTVYLNSNKVSTFQLKSRKSELQKFDFEVLL